MLKEKGIEFYLNVVGYEETSLTQRRAGWEAFYLNVVGYEVK